MRLSILEVEKNVLGLRVRVFGCRVHHGMVGAAMTAYGLYLVAKDLADFPWLRDS